MRAFLDANVFVSTWTLDVLLSLAQEGLFEPAWSQAVLDEFVRVAGRLGRLEDGKRVCSYAAAAFPEALVSGWEPRVDELTLPDPDDRHVVAAAVQVGCDIIVTHNLRDFPVSSLRRHGVVATSPDDLLAALAGECGTDVLRIMHSLVESKRHPPRTMEEEIAGLRRCRLPKFAEWLEKRVA